MPLVGDQDVVDEFAANAFEKGSATALTRCASAAGVESD
jgi:hypothetical protein